MSEDKLFKNGSIESFMLDDVDVIRKSPFKYMEWEIKPLTVEQMIKINPYILAIAKQDMDEFQEFVETGKISEFCKLFDKYGEAVQYVVNTIVGEDISNKITPDDYIALFIGIIYRMGNKSFQKSISLIQKLSLQTRAGIIAAEERLKKSMILPN